MCGVGLRCTQGAVAFAFKARAASLPAVPPLGAQCVAWPRVGSQNRPMFKCYITDDQGLLCEGCKLLFTGGVLTA